MEIAIEEVLKEIATLAEDNMLIVVTTGETLEVTTNLNYEEWKHLILELADEDILAYKVLPTTATYFLLGDGIYTQDNIFNSKRYGPDVPLGDVLKELF